MTPPGCSSPDASAASTIFSAMRSFTDPPGLRYSILASTVAAMPSVTEVSLTRGVSPTRSTMCSANFTGPSSHGRAARPARREIAEAPTPSIGHHGCHGRLPRGEPRQLGRARHRARRERGVRLRPVRRRPGAPQRRRALRPPAARRRGRADRHPPAVPHRHRHALAGPARRPDDGARPVAGVAGAGPPLAADAGRRRRLRRGRHLLGARGRGWAHLRPRLHRHRRAVLAAGHRPLGRGRRRPPRARRAAVRARGAPDDVGRRRDPHRRPHPRATPTSRRPSRSTSRRTAPTSRTTTSSSTPVSCRGTTASARRSPPCSTTGWS